MHNELQDVMGQSFGVPDDIDEDDLMGELDALEDELAQEAENPTASGVPSYLQVEDPSSCSASRSTRRIAVRSLSCAALSLAVR